MSQDGWGEVPRLSVLLPTRDHPVAAAQSIRSLWSAKRPVEVVCWCDGDDPATVGAVYAAGARRIIVGMRLGYKGAHFMFADLARIARGGWLLLWNDDATMLAPGWDAILDPVEDRFAEPWVIGGRPDGGGVGADSSFPILSRGWVELFPHMSRYSEVASYACQTARKAGRYIPGYLPWHHENLVPALRDVEPCGAWFEGGQDADAALVIERYGVPR